MTNGALVIEDVRPDDLRRLDTAFFNGKYQKRLQRTQIIYYPPHPAGATPDTFGLAPHTDFGCITLLWQDGTGGLHCVVWGPGDPYPAHTNNEYVALDAIRLGVKAYLGLMRTPLSS